MVVPTNKLVTQTNKLDSAPESNVLNMGQPTFFLNVEKCN